MKVDEYKNYKFRLQLPDNMHFNKGAKSWQEKFVWGSF